MATRKQTLNKKMAKKVLNQFVSNNQQNISLEMSTTQDTFVPHWIIRPTGDFVSDVVANAKDNVLKDVQTKKAFIDVIVNALNIAYGTELKASDYDFGAKYSREEVIARAQAKAQAKADKTTPNANAKAYIDAFKDALDKAVKSGLSVSEEQLKTKIENEVPKELQADVLSHWNLNAVAKVPKVEIKF